MLFVLLITVYKKEGFEKRTSETLDFGPFIK